MSLLISSLLSLLVGTIAGLTQTRIKRLYAFSTISHVGFILLALAINTEQSIDSLIFYIIQYSLTNLNTFLIIIAFGYIIHSSAYFSILPSTAALGAASDAPAHAAHAAYLDPRTSSQRNHRYRDVES